jgi:hypothetical protein
MSETHCAQPKIEDSNIDDPKIADPKMADQKIADPKIADQKIAPQKITDRLKNSTISEILEDGIENFMRWLIFWESDDKQLGMIIGIMHHAFIYSLVLWYLYLHTFSDSYIQFVLLWFIILLIWLQHLFCGVCLFFNIEQKLIGDHPNIIDYILSIFRITPTENVGNGVLLIISSLIITMVSCELISRTIIGIKNWL